MDYTVAMVKRFWKRSLLLLLLLLMMVVALNRLALTAGNYFKDGAAQVCQSKRRMVQNGEFHYMPGKMNVLFMGTSRILAGIQPLLFDELNENRTHSYNLALPALPIGSAYFMLKDFLSQNPAPQYVVLELYLSRCRTCTLFNYYAVQGISGFGEKLTLALHARNKSILWNILLPLRMYRDFIPRYLIQRLLTPKELLRTATTNRQLLDRMESLRGYYFIAEQASIDAGKDSPPGPAEQKKSSMQDPFQDPFVEKFFHLTQTQGIQVMLIRTPYREGQYIQFQEIPDDFLMIMQRYPNVTTAPEGWKLQFYAPQYFSDKSHLTEAGAAVYTGEIQKQFNTLFITNQ